jgi:hypothetical protein
LWYRYGDFPEWEGTEVAEYKIVEKEAPPTARGRKSPYADIVADFMTKGISSGLVQLPSRKPSTIQQGLIKAVRSAGAPLMVRKVDDEVYLVRK